MDIKKLDIGCGKNKKEGFVGIDIFDWSSLYAQEEFICGQMPEVFSRFKDGIIEKVYARHSIEHISQDFVIETFNEIYRILIPSGIFEIYVPPTQTSDGKACRGAFCDPTHKSYWNEWSFRYFDMRHDKRLSESYGIKCNFLPMKIEILDEINMHVILKKV